jgi:DNA-binding PadR family transcriptional regulator
MPKPKIDPNRPLAAQAVMNVDKGEEIAGAWVTPHVPQIGIYKLLAKKKKDGACEWAHFVQRDNGLKEKVYRGTVENAERLKDVVAAINSALRTTYGPNIQLQVADADVYTLDGKKDSGIVH